MSLVATGTVVFEVADYTQLVVVVEQMIVAYVDVACDDFDCHHHRHLRMKTLEDSNRSTQVSNL